MRGMNCNHHVRVCLCVCVSVCISTNIHSFTSDNYGLGDPLPPLPPPPPPLHTTPPSTHTHPRSCRNMQDKSEIFHRLGQISGEHRGTSQLGRGTGALHSQGGAQGHFIVKLRRGTSQLRRGTGELHSYMQGHLIVRQGAQGHLILREGHFIGREGHRGTLQVGRGTGALHREGELEYIDEWVVPYSQIGRDQRGNGTYYWLKGGGPFTNVLF